ncbi:MAG: hypothetical protein Q7O66_02825 [Dehalococcoidia bacterium]|nr:hypothetical protein [Dehalococcoidia bacterium]
MNIVLSLLSTSVTIIFAILVLRQYASRRKPYQLVWGLALIMFGIGTGCELVAAIGGWSLLPYELWWTFGAFFGAAYLGQGTVYLLAPRWVAHLTLAILGISSVVAAYSISSAPINIGDFALINAGQMPLNEAMPKNIRLFTIPFNVYGTVALIGGAIYSAAYYRSKKTMGSRALGNILIAVGAMVVAAGGTVAKAGRPEYLFVAELVGMAIIFAGYLKTR